MVQGACVLAPDGLAPPCFKEESVDIKGTFSSYWVVEAVEAQVTFLIIYPSQIEEIATVRSVMVPVDFS